MTSLIRIPTNASATTASLVISVRLRLSTVTVTTPVPPISPAAWRMERWGFFFPLYLPEALSVRGWTPAFLLNLHRLCCAIEGRRLRHFQAQDGLAECDQSRKNPLKESRVAGNWTRATGRIDSEIHSFSHWAIVYWATVKRDSDVQ